MTAANERSVALDHYRKSAAEVEDAWQAWRTSGHGYRADARSAYRAALDREDEAFKLVLELWTVLPVAA